MRIPGLPLLLALAVAVAAEARQQTARALVDEGRAHMAAGRLENAVRVLNEAVAVSTAAGNARERGSALRALAEATSLRGDVARAGRLFDEAREAFAEAGDESAIGALLNARAIDAYRRSALDEAERYWLESLVVFQSIGSLTDQANILRNFTFLSGVSAEDKLAVLEEALALARAAGNSGLEGLIRAQQGDQLFAAGNYASSLAHTEEALRLLEAADPRSHHVARTLTSLGRTRRFLGYPEDAIAANRRAAELLEAARDYDGAAQASLSIALATLDQTRSIAKAEPFFREAVAFARRSTRAFTLPFVLGVYAAQLAAYHEPALDRAFTLLDEAERLNPQHGVVRGTRVALLNAAGRHTEALTLAEHLIEDGAGIGALELAHLHRHRAIALERLARFDDALEALSGSIDVIERVRDHLVPADHTRQSYAEQWRDTLAQRVRLLMKLGRTDEALVASEQGRARAFVDALAAREDVAHGAPRLTSPATAPPEELLTPARRYAAFADLVVDIRRRRPAPPAAPRVAALDAALAAPPATLATIRSTAAALESYLLAYWVEKNETVIWVVAPDGRITCAVSDIGEERLADLVQATWASDVAVGGASRSLDDDTAQEGARRDTEPAWSPVLGSEGRLAFDTRSQRAFAALERALLAPVRDLLPLGADPLVTIVPHGPLFRLAFSALPDPRGRYLIEDARVSYAPSIAALAHTVRATARTSTEASAVVIADPEIAPGLAKQMQLTRLPGASAEGQAAARALGPRTTLLRGTTATESRVRESLSGARVLHFATHGVIRDDRPMTSFLALGGSAADPHDDGRLTTAEIYELSLDADLVVLSACRSALGPVTGDGITGLTRAFFVAGAQTVIASLWDLPDAVTAPLLSRFYDEWPRAGSKAGALRNAQLHLLRELRAGRIAVDTPAGRFVVPEHPSLWAGLILVGQP